MWCAVLCDWTLSLCQTHCDCSTARSAISHCIAILALKQGIDVVSSSVCADSDITAVSIVNSGSSRVLFWEVPRWCCCYLQDKMLPTAKCIVLVQKNKTPKIPADHRSNMMSRIDNQVSLLPLLLFLAVRLWPFTQHLLQHFPEHAHRYAAILLPGCSLTQYCQ